MYIQKIFVDLDGVLFDFDRKVFEITGKKIVDIPKKEMWQAIYQYNKTTPFFESLPLMEDAPVLLDYLAEWCSDDEVEILTASGHSPADAGDQKMRACQRHFGGKYKVNVVKKSPEKAAFTEGRYGCVLIDDRAKCIDPWVEAGGIGILHESAEKTIEELERILTAPEPDDVLA